MHLPSLIGPGGTPRRRIVMRVLLAVSTLGLVVTLILAPGGRRAFSSDSPPALRLPHGRPVLLPGSIPPALHGARRLRDQDRSATITITVELGLANRARLAGLIAAQHDPQAAQFNHFLTPQAFRDGYAPDAQDVTAVRQFLASAGLAITAIAPNRTLISAQGTVAQVEHALGITVGVYQLGSREVFGPDGPPQLPETLAATIVGIGGLDDVQRPRSSLTSAAIQQEANQASARLRGRVPLTGPITGAYSPTQLRGAYDVTPIASGVAQSIAVVELAPFIPGDITAYRTQYGLPNALLATTGGGALITHAVDGANPTCSAGGDLTCDVGAGIKEADLNIEVLSAIAPEAAQDVYVGQADARFIDVYNQVVVDDQDSIVTTSWGLCEPFMGQSQMQALDNIFAQAAAQGQTVFAASGDFGSDDCGAGPSSQPSVSSPASDPYVLGVGGTTLTLNSGSYVSETTWNNAYGASGGGLSSYFARPAWQVGVGVVNTFSTGAREIPDLAAVADPAVGYSVYCSSAAECGGPSSGWGAIGGTSASAPLWAGMLADINGYLSANHAAPARWANWSLYQIFSNAQAFSPYHDVTTGNNNLDYPVSSPYNGDYPATVCYDQATGMGSPDAWNMAQDLQRGIQTHGAGTCPVAGVTNLILDGSFELPSGSSPWSQSSFSGGNVIASSALAHSGMAAAFPCGYVDCDDRVWQTFTTPATVNSATLSFWLEAFSSLGLTAGSPLCLDHLYVTLSTPDGTVLSSGALETLCENVADTGYQLVTVDISSQLRANLGRQLVLTFRGTTANVAGQAAAYTNWAVDDVALNVA